MNKHTKLANYLRADSCWNRAKDDEPVFVLRANDPIAPYAARCWIKESMRPSMHMDKLDDATECALDMEQWRMPKYSTFDAWVMLNDRDPKSILRTTPMNRVYSVVEYRVIKPDVSMDWLPLDCGLWASVNQWLAKNSTCELRARLL